MADAARADGARADARLRGLGRRRVPPGGAGHQAAASRHGWRGTTGQDQHYPTGEGGGASDRPQRQVGLMAGQRGRPPPACRSPVPRHVTGTMSHVPITPARSRPGRHCSSVTPGNSAGSRPHTRVDPYGGSSSASGASKKSLATAPIDMSPGWMVSAGPGSAPGLIFTYGGSSGSDQTTLRLALIHRLILSMCQQYPRGRVLGAHRNVSEAPHAGFSATSMQ